MTSLLSAITWVASVAVIVGCKVELAGSFARQLTGVVLSISDTAFVHSSKGWQYCDDSKISQASERDVVVSWTRSHVCSIASKAALTRSHIYLPG
jgi:hypothetical protein